MPAESSSAAVHGYSGPVSAPMRGRALAARPAVGRPLGAAKAIPLLHARFLFNFFFVRSAAAAVSSRSRNPLSRRRSRSYI